MFSNKKINNLLVLLIILFSIFLTINNFVDLGFSKKVNLGLDLKGGSHLLMEVDFDYYLKEQLQDTTLSLKQVFLDKKIKALPKFIDNGIEIFYKTEKDYKLVSKQLDKKVFNANNVDNNKIFVKFNDNYVNELKKKVNRESVEIIRKRIDEFGTKDSLIQVEGDNKILIQIAGLSDSTELKELLGKTAKLTFHIVVENFIEDEKNSDVLKLNSIDGLYELNVEKQSLLGGDSLLDASVVYNERKPTISFKFNSFGANKFSEITSNNIGKMLAIVLDDKIVTAPRINGRVDGGQGVITGDFSFDEATKIALLLRSGSLIAPLKIIEEKTVGATLGQDLIKQGTISCLVGFVLILLFITIFYRRFCIYSNITSFINIFVLIALLSIFGATLTLPGIAGIVLTIGMSVDSCILIFERIKEEYNKDEDSIKIINRSFDNIMSTILDANITTIIVAVILYIFGSGAVKGFGVILILGILSSLFSGLICLKIILNIVYKNKKLII